MVLAAGAGTNQPALLWKLSVPDLTGGGGEGGAEAAPAVADDGTVYLATFFGRLCAISPAGHGIWQFQAGREIHSAPAIGDDGTIYFGCRDWRMYAVTPAGQRKWTFPTGGWVDSSPALGADGTVYFGSWDGMFYAVSPDGVKKWSFAAGGIVDSSPAIGADGTIYFGSHDNNLYALKPDGTLRWKSPVLDAAGNIFVSPGNFNYSLGPDGRRRYICGAAAETDASALAVPGGEVLFPHPWRYINAYLDGNQAPLWTFEMSEGSPLPSLVMSRTGVIYAMNNRTLYAFGSNWGADSGSAGTWPMFHANARHTGRVSTR